MLYTTDCNNERSYWIILHATSLHPIYFKIATCVKQKTIELIVRKSSMLLQASFRLENFRANITLSGLHVTHTVNVQQMRLKILLVFRHKRADVTIEWLRATDIMKSRQVSLQNVFVYKCPAANFTLETVRVFRSSAALSMRRVAVSADRWLVVEHHVAELTPDSRNWRHLSTELWRITDSNSTIWSDEKILATIWTSTNPLICD